MWEIIVSIILWSVLVIFVMSAFKVGGDSDE